MNTSIQELSLNEIEAVAGGFFGFGASVSLNVSFGFSCAPAPVCQPKPACEPKPCQPKPSCGGTPAPTPTPVPPVIL